MDHPETARILENVETDACIAPDREAEFFNRISARKEFTDHRDACEFALNATLQSKDDLLCTGKEVPQDRFQTLVRIVLPENLRFIVGDDYMRRGGFTDYDMETDEVTVRNCVEDYDGAGLGGQVGRPGGIAWAAEDSQALGSIRSDGAALTDRLGLEAQHRSATDRGFYVRLAIARQNLPTSLHVPRILDGIGFAAFRPVADCSSATGMTFPLSGNASEGFPEAVHRACAVPGFELSFEKP